MSGNLIPGEEKSSSSGNGKRMASHTVAIAVALIIVAVIAGGVLVNESLKEQPVPPANTDLKDHDLIYQVSTIDALMSSLYGGVTTVADLKKHGDFGSGTFEGLDGELIAIDGHYYQAKADGTVNEVDPSLQVPFATVKFFARDITITTNGRKNLTEFQQAIDSQLPSKNLIYAVRGDGTFPEMTVRAIPKQYKPYPLLSVAAEQQSVIPLKNTSGTIIGFYFPYSFRGINIPGYHFHFISSDHTSGGHILDFRTSDSSLDVQVDQAPAFIVELPTKGEYIFTDLSIDYSRDLDQIERKTT
jgi:acetolactate decarboxylase